MNEAKWNELEQQIDELTTRMTDAEWQLADIIEGRSPPSRRGGSGIVLNWTGNPARCIFKCLLKPIRIHFSGLDIVAEFKRLAPGYQSYFDKPVSDRAIQGRAYMGSLEGYESEWPELHPKTRPYFSVGQEIFERGIPTSNDEIDYAAVHKRLPRPEAPKPESVEPSPPRETLDEATPATEVDAVPDLDSTADSTAVEEDQPVAT